MKKQYLSNPESGLLWINLGLIIWIIEEYIQASSNIGLIITGSGIATITIKYFIREEEKYMYISRKRNYNKYLLLLCFVLSIVLLIVMV